MHVAAEPKYGEAAGCAEMVVRTCFFGPGGGGRSYSKISVTLKSYYCMFQYHSKALHQAVTRTEAIN